MPNPPRPYQHENTLPTEPRDRATEEERVRASQRREVDGVQVEKPKGGLALLREVESLLAACAAEKHSAGHEQYVEVPREHAVKLIAEVGAYLDLAMGRARR